MDRKLCIIYANCQGDELERLLKASPAFSRIYRIERYTNYIKELVPSASLQNCALFLYQYMGPAWGEASSDVLSRQLPASAIALRLPNLFFNGCWPLWTNDSPVDFGDKLLDRLIDEGSPKSVILTLYLHKDIRQFVDMRASLEECIEKERAKERDAFTRMLPLVLRRWKTSMLYHTVNHPGAYLLRHLAREVLAALNLPPPTRMNVENVPGDAHRLGLRETFPSYADFDLPIHPQVAAFHGLQFAPAGRSYAVFGRRLTFEQYISRYIDFRQNGFSEGFLAYLQLV